MTDTTPSHLEAPGSDPDVCDDTQIQRKFYYAAWRWHFYAGLYVVPFLVMLAVTGLAMLYINVFDARYGEAARVVASGELLPASAQAEAALALYPGGEVVQYIAPLADDRAALFRVDSGETAMLVTVDPYTGQAIGAVERGQNWYDIFNDIHGTLFIGDLGDRLIEIAAGLAIVLIVTGLYVWWPRNKGWTRALFPDLGVRGRALWKELHSVTGFYLSVVLLVFLITGLSWAGIWGDRFVQAWSTFPAEKWDDVPLSDLTHRSLNHDGVEEVPWALEKTPLPASGSDAGRAGLAPGTPITLDTVAAFARELGFEGRFQLNLPQSEDGVFTISQDSMSNDTKDPTSDRTVHIDRYSGRILADVRFEDYSLAGKGMAVGIAFHEGDMGLWNIVLNTVFCLAVIFVAVSGVVMWWKRRPSKFRIGAPPLPVGLPLWKGAVCIGLLLSLAFPLVGLTLLVAMAFDLLVLQNVRPLQRAFQ